MTDRIGRPPQINRDDVVAAGVEVGLTELSTKAVATRLGVTPGALYHHVANVEDLRLAIGERITAAIELPAPTEDPVQDLVGLALVLRAAERRHPGVGAYFATVGPEGEGTRELMADASGRLRRHGLDPVDATMVTGILANVAFAFAAREANSSAPLTESEGEALLAWVAGSLASGLLADLGGAPWRVSPPTSPGSPGPPAPPAPRRTDP